MRSIANAIIVGCWHYDTFLGRKWEIEHALHSTVTEVLDTGAEYLVCTNHKTAKTYGNIVKYLTPGLREGMKVYNTLPRRDACTYFLHPVSPKSETVSAHHSLQTFNRLFLTGHAVSPTTNVIRKLFHKTLMKLTKNEDAMKDFMTVLDAHGRKVQDKHYCMRDPDDDLMCAKVLVKHVIGTPVAWPTTEEASIEQPSADARLASPEFAVDAVDENAESEYDYDAFDDTDEHWQCGDIFGVLPLGQLPLLDCEPHSELAEQVVLSLVASHRVDDDVETRVPVGVPDNIHSVCTTDRAGSKRTRRAAVVAPPRAKPSPRAKPKAVARDVDVQNHHYYQRYEVDKIPGIHRKTPVDPDAHVEMERALANWQAAENKTTLEQPFGKPWYWNMRCNLIDRNLLTRSHCWDVCRSHIGRVIRKRVYDNAHPN